jgi:hypothetical protein
MVAVGLLLGMDGTAVRVGVVTVRVQAVSTKVRIMILKSKFFSIAFLLFNG